MQRDKKVHPTHKKNEVISNHHTENPENNLK